MANLSLAVLTLSLCYAVYDGGTLLLHSWVLGLGSFLAYALACKGHLPSPPLPVIVPLGAVFVYAVFQLVPVPAGLIALLSPVRFEVVDAARGVLGSVSTAALTASVADGAQRVNWAGAAILAFAVSNALSSRQRLPVWAPVVPVLALASGSAVLGLVQAVGGPSVAHGTFVNRNHFAGFLELALPFALVLIVYAFTGGGRVVAGAAGVAALGLCIAGVVLSQSRMGYAASIAGLASAALLLVTTSSTGGGAVKRGGGVLTVVAAACLAFLLFATPVLIGRFGTLENPDGPPDATRSALWHDAVTVIEAYPIAGCGYGAYHRGAQQMQKAIPAFFVNYAHNDYLQLAAELGIPAMIMLAAAAFFAVRLTVRNIRKAPTPELRYRAIACLGAYVAIALHSFVDFNLYVPANLMALAWIAGIGTAE
ncbi:MAG TPA: O-antigen ligase family protein [Bryobacteraceae bacterium]|nr:O-antigen ligase family protein [Bryobacteraceae bacterium]